MNIAEKKELLKKLQKEDKERREEKQLDESIRKLKYKNVNKVFDYIKKKL